MSRVIVVLVGLGLLVALLLWGLGPKRQASVQAPPSEPPPGTVVLREAAPAQAAQPEAPALARLPLEALQPDMVSYATRQGNRWVLHMVDGSQREVYPFEVAYLPEELRLRLEYEREGR